MFLSKPERDFLFMKAKAVQLTSVLWNVCSLHVCWRNMYTRRCVSVDVAYMLYKQEIIWIQDTALQSSGKRLLLLIQRSLSQCILVTSSPTVLQCKQFYSYISPVGSPGLCDYSKQRKANEQQMVKNYLDGETCSLTWEFKTVAPYARLVSASVSLQGFRRIR